MQRLIFFRSFIKPNCELSLSNVDHNHSIIPLHVQLPAMEGNPSSLANVKNHLRQYGSFVRIPKYCEADEDYKSVDSSLQHHWFYLTVDGKPRLLILNLQENQYRCLEDSCGYKTSQGYGFEALVEHLENKHKRIFKSIKEEDFCHWREFNFPLVLSGKGHKEKNMLEVLFNFNWTIIIEHCAEAIGFVSPKQKILLKKVKDHHKAFDFFMIMMEACEKEIVFHALRKMKMEGCVSKPNSDKLNDIITSFESKNENFAYSLIFLSQMKSISLHRIGMRLNRNSLIKAGEDCFSKLWFMNANLPYCTIYAADFYQDQCMDSKVRQEINKSLCIIKSKGKYTTGESFDYIFEEENKALKRILPPNPTFDSFRVATLVKDEGEVIVREVKGRYNIPLTGSQEKEFPNYEDCIRTVRKVIRQFVGNPNERKSFQTLGEDTLNSALIYDYEKESSRRRELFFDEILQSKKFSKAKHKEKPFQIVKKKPTLEDITKEINAIVDGEEDSVTQCDILRKVNTISMIQDSKTKERKMAELLDQLENAM